MKQLFIYVTIMMTGYTASPAQSAEGLVARADSLYERFEERKALTAYQKILDRDSTDFTALWRASFLYSRIGNRFESDEKKRAYFEKAESLAWKALQVDSLHIQSNFVMAVAKGRKALIAGPRERVKTSQSIKRFVDEALRLDSTHAGAWHLLGRWHYEAANLGFFERLAANTLFGGIPDNPSNRRAAKALQRAIDLKPEFVLYYHDLAQVFEAMGREGQAATACRFALEKKSLTPDDPDLKQECKRWIDEWR